MVKRIAVLLALVAVALVAGCGGSGDKPGSATTPASTTGQSAEQSGSESAAKVTPVEVGEPASAGTWTLTVKGVERVAEAGGASAGVGEELLVLRFDLKNGGTKDQGTGPVYFKLTGSDGTAYEASPTGDPLFIFNTPQPIKSGETREIMIAYAIPTGTTPLQWAFTPFSEGGEVGPAVVNIK